jgi:putative endonuclease
VTNYKTVIPAKAGIQESLEETSYRLHFSQQKNGTLYVGVTSDLVKRVWEHKNNFVEGFTKKYSVHQLVWYEWHDNIESAVKRERQIKEWKRNWKLELIEQLNPNWHDLYDDLI